MHITNNNCKISVFVGVDKKNEPIYKKPHTEGCSVITYRLEQAPTPVRADTSASQGRATIKKAMIRIMLPPLTKATFGSMFSLISIPNERYKFVQKDPRFDAMGQLDHYQCDLEIL